MHFITTGLILRKFCVVVQVLPYKEVSGRSDFYEINVVILFKHFSPPSGLLASDFVYVIVSCETNETYADLWLR